MQSTDRSLLNSLRSSGLLSNLKYFKVGMPLEPPFCNFGADGCSHCYVGPTKAKKVSVDESVVRYKKTTQFAEVSKELGIGHIALVGTEPTLDGGFIGLIGTFHQWDMFITVCTNGWYTGSLEPFKIPTGEYDDGWLLIDDMVDDSPKIGIMVSIDGIGDVHDQFRNKPGSYMRAIRTLSNINTIGFGMASGIESVIHSGNYHKLKELTEILAGYKPQLIKMVPILAVGNAKGVRAFNEEERAEIQETLAELVVPLFSAGINTDFAGFSIDFPSFTIDNLTSCTAALNPKYFYLRNVEYEISPCGYPQLPAIGSLLDKSLVELMADTPNSWPYKMHLELKEKGVEEVGRIVTDPGLRAREYNMMCGPCLILANVYKVFHETGDIDHANKVAREMFLV